MISKTKTNRSSLARVFPRLAPVTCICFEFWLVLCVVWLHLIGRSNYFGFGLKTALSSKFLNNLLTFVTTEPPSPTTATRIKPTTCKCLMPVNLFSCDLLVCWISLVFCMGWLGKITHMRRSNDCVWQDNTRWSDKRCSCFDYIKLPLCFFKFVHRNWTFYAFIMSLFNVCLQTNAHRNMRLNDAQLV